LRATSCKPREGTKKRPKTDGRGPRVEATRRRSIELRGSLERNVERAADGSSNERDHGGGCQRRKRPRTTGVDLFKRAISSLLQPVPVRPSFLSSSFNSRTVMSLAHLMLILAASKLNTSPSGCFYSRSSPVSFRPPVLGSFLSRLAVRSPQLSIFSSQLAARNS